LTARACVLQHIRCEPPGLFSGVLRARGIAAETVELDEGGRLPDWRGLDLVIAMGGPMGAHDDAQHPWLAGERSWIAAAVHAGVPFFGVCLGAQLLAASLGAPVRTGAVPEVGVLPVTLTGAARGDPVFGALGTEFPALQWHGDTFTLPGGAQLLASSPAYEQQAFVWQRAYGLQFHIEVGTRLAREWGEVPAYAASLEAIQGPGALPQLIEQIQAREQAMTGLARRLFAAWLDHVVG
jgi:GMP synthase-like glutamine amidotransferase